MDVAGGDQRDVSLPGEFEEALQFAAVVRAAMQFGEQRQAVAEEVAVGGERGEGREERDARTRIEILRRAFHGPKVHSFVQPRALR
jgi:hypothetical protein